MLIMLILFSNFYRQEYIKKSNERKKRKQYDMNNNEILDKDSAKKSDGKFYSTERQKVPKKMD